jgi:exosortase A
VGTAVKHHIFQNRKFILASVSLLLIWTIVFWQGISTAIEIWIGSDIFNHCLLVIPGSFYLIYCQRYKLDLSLYKPNYWLLPILIGTLIVYAVGIAGDVQLFMHLATFAYLPIVIWMFLGNKLAYRVTFPLFFIFFSIPFGEEFIPLLQEITADWSVILLQWSGIPIYRSGLYIEIPQGRFLVAEACSGISFFIASVVIGSLYAYLNIYSWKRKVFFVSISIVFPVVANAIRVYGIILTGYLTDMEHAVGADHLIYGWIFFSLVIICLLAIGEMVREKSKIVSEDTKTEVVVDHFNLSAMWRVGIIICALLCVFYIWINNIQNQLKLSPSPQSFIVNNSLLSKPINEDSRLDWSPKFKEPFSSYRGSLSNVGSTFDVYIAWYPKGGGELITSLNRLYHEKSWTLEQQESVQISSEDALTVSTIVNPEGKRLLAYWYVIDGEIYFDKRIAKLVETWNVLLGKHVGSGLIAISKSTDNVNLKDNRTLFKAQLSESLDPLSKVLKFN